ncbi:hypothetical protein LPJ66_003484 [Kickxella alabastrina]|uniref:Uncharacterized protein n=1 Tax=Kickxella alabastrina TaxID=61397 RepID=A0ACC1IKN1_9FUNG|nr:hypothetical protein LPJ66_003484 [Kickxella alabastrina]
MGNFTSQSSSSGAANGDEWNDKPLTEQEISALTALLKPHQSEPTNGFSFQDYMIHYLKHNSTSNNAAEPRRRLSRLLHSDKRTQPEVIYAFAQLDCTEKPGLSLRGFVHATIKRAMFAVWNMPVDSVLDPESWAVGWCLTQPRDAIVKILFGGPPDGISPPLLDNPEEPEAAWMQCADNWLEMATTPGGVDPGSWRAWWMGSAVFPQLFNLAISHTIYGDSRVVIRGRATEESLDAPRIPKAIVSLWTRGSNPASVLLTPMLAWALCRELPAESRRSWDRVYSSSRDGRSWSSFQSTIERRGAVLLLVQETTPIADAGETTEAGQRKSKYPRQQRIFGAYFNSDLERRPSWHGSPSNFVFSLSKESPLGLSIFRATGFNNHYQYFNYATKTLPNGLGAGGQLGHFGLWIDSGFTRGCSNSAATFGSRQLSTETEFAVDVVEAWLVRPSERLDEVGGGKGSVLDTNPEAMAFLELANRPMYSKMLPDPVNDSD